MNKRITILFKPVGAHALIKVQIENNLKAYQDLIGGYIQVVTLDRKILIILDEEGRLKDLPLNIHTWQYGDIVGDIAFVSEKGEEFTSLTDEQQAYLSRALHLPIKQLN